MAELGLPTGDCICTREDHRVRVDQADPRVLIDAEVLATIDSQGPGAWPWNASLDHAQSVHHGHGYVGSVLKIHGVNRTVIYRITGYVPSVHGYIGEWPD
jgi:hypothetical protein